jgi:hypothetical protein
MRSVLLGLRVALAGGRESRVRFGLTVLGTALGTLLILLTLIVMPALQGRIDRYAWHRTDADSPATATDPLLWLPVTERYDGRSLVRFQVAALGEEAPVPPGMARLPEPGEVFVSPALAELLGSVPENELAQRFPGEVVDLIGADGLVSPDELVAVIGRTPEELRDIPGTMTVRGIEQPGEPIDLGIFIQALVTFIAVLLIGPVVVFVMIVTKVDAARREQRFAALRLAGAARWQTGVMAVGEAAAASILGAGLGYLAYELARALLSARLRFEDLRFPVTDLRADTWQIVLVTVAVPLVAVTTSLVTLYRAQISPLGARRQVRRRRPTLWRLAPLGVGIGLIFFLTVAATNVDATVNPAINLLSLGAALSLLVGLYTSGAYLCMWVSRALARLSFSAPALMAARRIAADPYATFRAVGGVALTTFVATGLAIGAASERTESPATSVVLDDGVVLVLTRGATDEALAPLLNRPGALVVREGPGGAAVLCADLATVTSIDCPLPRNEATEEVLHDLFGRIPFPRDPPLNTIPPAPTVIAEPSPSADQGQVHSIFVPTDGTTSAIERVRTQAILAAPYGLARTSQDWAAARQAGATAGGATIFQLAMLFVMIVAACSLTVSVVATMVERRRPFALLRASGMPLGQLRRLALFETSIPLVVTALGGMAVTFVLYLVGNAGAALAEPESPEALLTLPDAAFFASLGGGLLGAIVVSMLSWPVMDAVTRHDNVRFE